MHACVVKLRLGSTHTCSCSRARIVSDNNIAATHLPLLLLCIPPLLCGRVFYAVRKNSSDNNKSPVQFIQCRYCIPGDAVNIYIYMYLTLINQCWYLALLYYSYVNEGVLLRARYEYMYLLLIVISYVLVLVLVALSCFVRFAWWAEKRRVKVSKRGVRGEAFRLSESDALLLLLLLRL